MISRGTKPLILKTFPSTLVMRTGRSHSSIMKKSMKSLELRWAKRWLMKSFWQEDKPMAKALVRWTQDLRRPKKTYKRESIQTPSKKYPKWAKWHTSKRSIQNFKSSSNASIKSKNSIPSKMPYSSTRVSGVASDPNTSRRPTKATAARASKDSSKRGQAMDLSLLMIKG